MYDTKIIGNIKFFGLDKLTHMLGLSKATLRAYIKNGTLKGRKIGVKWYVCEDSVNEYLNTSVADSLLNTKVGAPASNDLNTSIIQSYIDKISQMNRSTDTVGSSAVSEVNAGSFIDALTASVKAQESLDELVQWENWIGTSGDFTYISPYNEVITGFAADEFYQDPNLFASIVHPADRTEYIKGLSDAIKTNKTYCIEHRIITKDKEIRWLRHQNWSVFSKSGKYLGRQVRLSDITHLKVVESASEVTDLLVNSLCENLRLSVIIIDSTYTVKSVKGVALLDSIMLFGQIVDTGVNLLRLPSEGNKDRVFSFVVNALNGAMINEEINCEYQGIQKKLRFSIYPIKSVQSVESRHSGLVCMVINETEITKFIVDLDLNRKFNIYDELPLMMHLLDANNNIHYVNNKWCYLTGFEPHEVVGKNISKFISEVSTSIADNHRHISLENNKFKGLPGYLSKKDGSQISVIIEGYKETDKSGKVWLVSLLREIIEYSHNLLDW